MVEGYLSESLEKIFGLKGKVKAKIYDKNTNYDY